jgi:hypothetical protein
MKTIDLQSFEDYINNVVKWQRVEDIPGFPLNNFDDVKKHFSSNQFLISIDFIEANKLAEILYGKTFKLLYHILLSTPFLISILAIILALTLKKYLLLIGVPLSFLCNLLANPYNPFDLIFKYLAFIFSLSFLWALSTGREYIALLSAFFVFPFWIRRFFYFNNRNKIMKTALNREKIFIYLYQFGKLGLIDKASGKRYLYTEFLSI